MIGKISNMSLEDIEAQCAVSLVTSTLVKQPCSIKFEERMYNKAKQEVLHNKSELHSSLRPSSSNKFQNANRS